MSDKVQYFVSAPSSSAPVIFRTEASPTWTGVEKLAAGYPDVIIKRTILGASIYYTLSGNLTYCGDIITELHMNQIEHYKSLIEKKDKHIGVLNARLEAAASLRR